MVSFSRPFVALALASCLASAALAQNVKLNLPLPLNPPRSGGDVVAFRLTPDESRLVYLAREEGDARSELYSLPLDGSGPAVRLTDAVPAVEAPSHEGLRFHPGSGELLFVSHASERIPDGTISVYRLYRVSPLGDGKAELVTRMDTADYWLVGDSIAFERFNEAFETDVFGARLDARSEPILLATNAEISVVSDQRVVYRQAHPGVPGFELWSVLPDGTGAARLDGPHVAGGRPLLDAAFTPDGKYLLYRADQLVDEQIELFRVPADGSAPAQRISGVFPADRDVRGLLAISPDSTRALLKGNLDVRGQQELFVVPIDGSSAPVEVSGPLQNLTDLGAARFSDDGTRVLYVADALTDERDQLFSVPSGGGGPALLLTPFTRDTDVQDLVFAGGRAFYRAQADLAADELYSVALDGSSAPVRIGQVSGLSADVRNYTLSRDGSRAVFFADNEQNQRFDLYATPADGSVPQSRLDVAGRALGAILDGDGTHAYFTAAEGTPDVFELYRRPADAGAAAVRLSRELSAGDVQGDVDSFALASGERVLYSADQTTDGVEELLAVDLVGPRDHVVLNEPTTLSKGLGVFGAAGSRALYVQRLEDGNEGLFSVPLDHGTAPVQLASAGRVDTFRWTPDELTVVFLALVESATESQFQLLAVPADGSAPARLLSTLVAQGDVKATLGISPDGTRAVYVADGTEDERFEFYSVLLDGSAEPIAISGALVAGGDVHTRFSNDTPLVTPDSSTLIFRADAEVDGRVELYSAALDGSTPRIELSGALVPGGVVEGDLALTPDGTAVLFRGALRTPGLVELFLTPVDGSAPPVRLSAELIADGDVASFTLTPDGTRVLYIADAQKDGSAELFVSALSGERGRLLSAPLVPGGNVQHVLVDPHSRHAVYLADQERDERAELFLVDLDGHSPPRRISAPLPDGYGAGDYFFALEGTAVVYVIGNLLEHDRVELFLAPLDPGRAVTRVSGPMAEGGGVRFFALTPDERRVVYQANQDDVGVFELYLSYLTPALAKRRL
jgi:Tol biopolymer transport system component